VKPAGIFISRCKALAFSGEDMKNRRPLQPGQAFEQRSQRVQIVPIHRPEVGDIQTFKKPAGRQSHSDGFFEVFECLFHRLSDDRQMV